MQTTTNLGLKKPDYTDFADIKDINDNMDTLDTKVADVRDSKVTFTDADLDSGITSFPTFLTKIVSGMKLAKFLRDFKAGMGYVLHTGSLINNATCTESGKALDARMGKTLQDQITSLNDSFQCGSKAVSFTTERQTVSISFTAAFSKSPVIVCSPVKAGVEMAYIVITSRSTSGFTAAYKMENGSADGAICWIAMIK